MSEETAPNPASGFSLNRVFKIARRFDITEPLEISDFPGKGNIHRQTFLVSAGQRGNVQQFLLQRLNTEVFARPDRVMDAIVSCIEAQNKALSVGALPAGHGWETIRLIPTKQGEAYLVTTDSRQPQYWRMMARIHNARSYRNLGEIPSRKERLQVARETGKGLALFGILTSGMNVRDVTEPLPGYRNTALYYDQLDSILRGNRTLKEFPGILPSDPLIRQGTERHYLVQLPSEEYRFRMGKPEVRRLIELALENREYGLSLQLNLQSGELKTVIVHGDTKLDNFLFSTATGKVRALVDLDTVMPHTWLSDWGDAARSLVHTAGENNTNPEGVDVDMDYFKALAEGFFGAAPTPPRQEVSWMVDATRIMALELGLRFLTDYLRGDTYFRLGAKDPVDLNRIRATVQFSIFQDLGRKTAEAKSCIDDLYIAGNKNLP